MSDRHETDRPPWVEPWIAMPGIPPPRILRAFENASPAMREAGARFPIGCVVRCRCGREGCFRYAIAIGLHVDPRSAQLHLTLTKGPNGDGLCAPPCSTHLEVIAYRGDLDEQTMRAILFPAGDA